MKQSTKTAAKIVYPLYLEVEPKIAEDLQRRIEESLDHQAEIHAREIRNMALDAYNEAFKAIMNSVKTAGFCSFCGTVISVHSTLAEAQDAMRTHILRCPKMHEALAQADTATMPLEPLTTEQLEDRLQNRTKHRQG